MAGKPFMKKDEGKPQLAFLPFAQLETIARVFDYGASKYARDNWKKGTFARYASACLRHLFDRLKGNKLDPESGLPHLAHAAACILMLMWFDDNRRG